jgi:hypothetical protein
MSDYQKYRIYIDHRWSLEDLYVYPRAYEQVYFALEALVPAEDELSNERIERAFQAFPWRGGYSAVNFYNQLKYATPRNKRPEVTEMKYASPGYIELLLNLPLAVKIAVSVTAVAGSIGSCNKVYNQIHSDLQKRKLLRIEVDRKKLELTKEQIYLVADANEKMADILNLDSHDTIDQRTNDPLISLKIFLSVYRRIRTLAEYENKGKASLKSLNKLKDESDV